jgi:Tfp pilus assembly protein PilO
MSKLPKEKRDKLILVILGAIGVAGILYTFILSNQKDTLGSLNAKITTTRDKLGKAERLVKSAPTIQERLKEGRDTLEARQKDMVPDGQEFYTFFKLFDQFRHQEKLQTSFIGSISKPEFDNPGVLPKIPYKAAIFGIRASGYFKDIGKFIADFENAYPYMRVQGLRLQPEGTMRFVPTGTTQEPAAPAANETLIGDFKVVTMIKRNAT